MDKRIILSMVVLLMGSVAIAAYRKFFYQHEGIHAIITPRDAVLHIADSISFKDMTEDADRRIWDFGDGEFSTSQSGSHTYLTPGKFRVRLLSYGSFGTLVDSSTEVVVLPDESTGQALAASGITGPEMVPVGEPIKYAAPITAESYEWRVEGDARLASNKQQGSVATYQFTAPGKKTVIVATRNPDKNFRKEILVQAASLPPAEPPVPIVSAAPAASRPPAEKPRSNQPARPARTPQSGRSNGESKPLPDLGDGVILDRD